MPFVKTSKPVRVKAGNVVAADTSYEVRLATGGDLFDVGEFVEECCEFCKKLALGDSIGPRFLGVVIYF